MRFIIGTRLYAYSIVGFDADSAARDPDLIRKKGVLSANTMASSLLNQTDQGYEHYTIVNQNAPASVSSIYRNELAKVGFKTELITLPEWSKMLRSERRKADGPLYVARIDDDDLVVNTAVETAKKVVPSEKSIVFGWTSGLRFRAGRNVFMRETVPYARSGHHSMLQTCVSVPGHEPIDPYCFDHSNVRKGLIDRGYTEKDVDAALIDGNRMIDGPAFIYVRHGDSVSALMERPCDDDSRYPRTDVDLGYLSKRFGFRPSFFGLS